MSIQIFHTGNDRKRITENVLTGHSKLLLLSLLSNVFVKQCSVLRDPVDVAVVAVVVVVALAT